MVIPTSSADKQNIILKEGQKVMVLKSPKGIYMQLESGKIIAIRTALKVGHNKDKSQEPTFMAREMQKRTPALTPLKTSTSPSPSASNTTANATGTATFPNNPKNAAAVTTPRGRGANHVQFGRNTITNKTVQMGTAKPYNLKPNVRNVQTVSDASVLLQSQFPMSNSNSSFDADLSDDSQFLEKLSENLANQKATEDDVKQTNKPKDTKCSEPITQSAQANEQQPNNKNQTNQSMQSHTEKINNGIGDTLTPTMVNDKPNSMQHSQIPNKPETMNHPYMNSSNADSYGNSMNNASANGQNNYVPHQSYNYNYNNSSNNGNYGDAQSAQQSQTSQQVMHQPNVMNTNQSEKYPRPPQHVN